MSSNAPGEVTPSGTRPAPTPAGAVSPRFAAAAVALIVLTLVAALTPLLPLGADDLGLVGVLSTDEELAGRTVRHMLTVRRPDPHGFFSYGAFSHELAALALAPLSAAGRLTDRAVIVAARGVSLLGAAAAVAFTAALAYRLGGGVAAVVAALGMAAMTELADWAVIAHPDTLQTALVATTLLAGVRLTERHTSARVAVGGALAGLVFATKYLGVLLLPLLLVAAAAGRARTPGAAWGWRPAAADAAGLVGCFFTVFALTNPYALGEPSGFVAQVRDELARARTGHVFAMGDGGAGWLRTLLSPAFAGPGVAALALGTAAVVLARAARRAAPVLPWPGRAPPGAGARSRHPFRLAVDGPVLVALWLVGYLGELVALVGYGAPRHALPLAPALAALAGVGAAAVLRGLRAHPGGASAAAWGGVLAVAGAVLLAPPLHETADRVAARKARADALAADPRVISGRWLAAQAPPGAVILRDAYVYLPPDRTGAPVTFGLTRAAVAATRPDYIVVNEDIRGRFRWEVGARRYVDGPAAYRERMETYAALEAGRLGCYRLLRDFGTVQVYGRAGEPVEGCADGD
jgi:4-amino-4-deoxy-L-arabinose transferase-like glycosyltransferase